ncbi:MAG: acyl-CoA dehydrogenase family protein [Deltaproteobacteria bacterium]|nr:acyl-CoA dehydrogenase family protein [Deltaproteobacteria bacterium]MBK8239260.1 acyl-CoA dehydrogenase family protein [Deltaproteobacteria bacterium]MBK8719664.1 acyl-CoA dehydrogenase family protein [Deltaproteobacteria bacterium]MBP7289640.1 acyl-CoA dehydrogenase family protein [Nannocystaceae bacterium]
MFDLRITDEQTAYIDTARKFAAEHIIPVAGHHDELGEMPLPVFRAAFDTGLVNVEIPEAYGGLGLHTLEGCLIAEELAYGCAGVATSIMCNHLGALPLLIAGTEAQKQHWLGALTGEFQFVSYCCSEPEAGSDVAAMRTRLTAKGDRWLLSGQKRWITNGGYAKFFTGFATIDPAARHKGITAFVIPRDLPGVSIGRKENKLGQRCSNTVDVIFEDVELGPEHLLGQPGGGFAVAMETFDKSRPMIAAQCAGIIRRAMDESIAYARERKTFGVPIAQHQAIQFMIAEMAMSYETVRLLYMKAAWEVDQGIRRTNTSSIAKSMGADLAMKCTTDAVQVFGGYGYTKEYPVEKLMRDAKLMQIYEGTSQVQRMVIAKNLLMRQG